MPTVTPTGTTLAACLLLAARATAQPGPSASTLIEEAEKLNVSGKPAAAVAPLQQAAALCRQAADPRCEAQALYTLGRSHTALAQHRDSLESYQSASKLRRQSGDSFELAMALHNLAAAHWFLGEPARAVPVYQEALALRRALNDQPGVALTLYGIGAAHWSMSQAQAALEAYRGALPLFRAQKNAFREADTLNSLGLVYAALGDADAALDHYEQAIAKWRSQNNAAREAYTFNNLGLLRLDLGEAKSALDLLMEQFARTGATVHAAAALHTAERARSRSLLDALGQARWRVREFIDPDLLQQQSALEQRLRQAAASVPAAKSAGDRESACRRVDALLEQWEEAERRIRARSPGYAGLTRPAIATAERVQSGLLDSSTVLLEYFLGERRSFLWTVMQDRLEAHVLPPRTRIEQSARRFHEVLQRPEQNASDAGVQLSRLLLEPAAPHLAGKRILVIADGILQYVPFAALPDPSQPLRHLVERHEIAYLPSASVGIQMREAAARPRAGKSIAVLADPVLDSSDARVKQPSSAPPGELSRLRFSRFEAQRILALAPPAQRHAALDFDASKELVQSGRLRGYRILHLATHAIVDSRHPDLSRIVLSQVDPAGRARDGALRLWEIYNLRLDADLVVLSACRTALGRQVRGEGVIGLARGFLYAGVPTAVASLWDVQDRATAELMARFHRGHLDGGCRRPRRCGRRNWLFGPIPAGVRLITGLRLSSSAGNPTPFNSCVGMVRFRFSGVTKPERPARRTWPVRRPEKAIVPSPAICATGPRTPRVRSMPARRATPLTPGRCRRPATPPRRAKARGTPWTAGVRLRPAVAAHNVRR